MPWELPDERKNHLTPPPQKRIKSADLYRAQHGLSPERELSGKDIIQPLLAATASVHRRSNDRSRDRERERALSCDQTRSRDSSSTHDRERDRSTELRDSLLGQALEGGPTLTISVGFALNFFDFFFSLSFHLSIEFNFCSIHSFI